MEVHTQGLSKPYCADYTATRGKNKMSEPRCLVLAMDPIRSRRRQVLNASEDPFPPWLIAGRKHARSYIQESRH
jgi:hypothetical protein